MKNATDEMVWEGRTHLGDEPGVYGDAQYSGLATEFPITLFQFVANSTDVTILLEADEIQIYPGYDGHVVTVSGYYDPQTGGNKWKEIPLASGYLDQASVEIKVPDLQNCRHISVRVRIDTTVMPGLYDDFVLTYLGLRSKTHYASFGFTA